MATSKDPTENPDQPSGDDLIDPGPLTVDVEERGEVDDELGWSAAPDARVAAEGTGDPGPLSAERTPTEG